MAQARPAERQGAADVSAVAPPTTADEVPTADVDMPTPSPGEPPTEVARMTLKRAQSETERQESMRMTARLDGMPVRSVPRPGTEAGEDPQDATRRRIAA